MSKVEEQESAFEEQFEELLEAEQKLLRQHAEELERFAFVKQLFSALKSKGHPIQIQLWCEDSAVLQAFPECYFRVNNDFLLRIMFLNPGTVEISYYSKHERRFKKLHKNEVLSYVEAILNLKLLDKEAGIEKNGL